MRDCAVAPTAMPIAQDTRLAFRVHGMDCGEEVAVLKRELAPLVGGDQRLGFDLLNGKLLVEPGQSGVTSQGVVEAVARTGMRAEPWRDAPTECEAALWQRFGRPALAMVSALFGLAGLISQARLGGGWLAALGAADSAAAAPLVSIALYSLGIVAGMWHVAPKAWRAAIRMRPDMNLLMSVAVIGAAAIGEWLEAVTVACLFSLSLLLESWSVGRARRAIAALMDLAPPTARVRGPGGSEIELRPEEVQVGTVLIVRPGERIPLDGTVVRGGSAVNQAPITGESVPAPKHAGAEVFAGTINGDGVLEIESTRPARDTTLARIVRLVGEAQSRRAPSEQWVEKFARVYTPAVMALAAAVFLVPPLFDGQWLVWLYRALVLLVIACPCALVISTPVSVVCALACAARQGVLVKGGVFMELPARLRAVAIDKTGTLTEGRPVVVEVVPLNGHDDAELLAPAAALEAHNNHPLAQAIVAAARERGISAPPAESLRTVPGKGATGRFDGRDYWLGSYRLLRERKLETPQLHARLEAAEQTGRTVVVVGSDSHVFGFIALSDSLRPGAAESLRSLHRAGIEHVVMLTGDNHATAARIAADAGIGEMRAGLLPEDKVAAVEALVREHRQVAMVGDGVNDAPAMAAASLGIAMGAAGSDAAIETADVALMSDDLSRLPWLVRHSRRTLFIIRQNITFSLAVKALFVILTFAGFASLWAAIAADMGASLLVITNALRLLRGPQKP